MTAIDRRSAIALTVAAAAAARPAQATSVAVGASALRGTGDLGIAVERGRGSVRIFETTRRTALARVEGLGDLSHASAVFSRDARHAYVFGRDGGLSKVDLLAARLVARRIQAGNSIGGAISQDGSLVAVANYEPGGVRVFDSESLEPVADVPTGAKVVGLVDAPDQRFVFSTWESGTITIADFTDRSKPKVTRIEDAGKQPYDAMITADGRWYVAGLFGEDGLALLDLWHPERGARRILSGYGRGEQTLPVYKMPHLEGWGQAGDVILAPAVGRHEILVVSMRDWTEVARIPVHGQPIFAVARPDGRQVWVNFALPHNDTVQVIDVEARAVVKEIKPGKGVLHLEFTPRGEQVWLSVRDEDRIEAYETRSFARIASLPAEKPSGIFLTARAGRMGF
ncbi:MAG: protein nirF [Alphaproteobacteria bacterium]|nr:protein nirF [Alphaproteobacteria bacterium]